MNNEHKGVKMNFIAEIFDRADIRQVRAFLLHGMECVDLSNKTYRERIIEPENAAIRMIEKKFPQRKEYEEVTEGVYSYVNAAQDVYMEIGLRYGALLVTQLLSGEGKE